MKTIATFTAGLLIGVLAGVVGTVIILYVALHENQQKDVRR